MCAHLVSQKLLQNLQFENLTFSQMTFSEISHLKRTTPFFIKALLSVWFYSAFKYYTASDKSDIEKEISYFASKTVHKRTISMNNVICYRHVLIQNRRPEIEVIKLFFMLNSTKQKNCLAHKC